MAVSYRIYSNGGTGGAVDYSSPIATTAGLTFATPALAAPSDTTFVVRAFDTASGFEEANTEAQVRIVVDADGRDVSARPNAPTHLAARATANGGARVEWSYNPGGQGGAPQGFKVWLTAGTSVNYVAAQAVTVPYLSGMIAYRADLTGLADETTYSIGVRSYNATATEPNMDLVTVVGEVAGPSPVDNLTATAT